MAKLPYELVGIEGLTRTPDQVIDRIGRYCDRISRPAHQASAVALSLAGG
jgi:hypothetical protein